MHNFLVFTVIGVSTGAVYALAATGLVVTYTTSQVFNFAHGALGMFVAFAFYQMRVAWKWPVPLALVVAVVILAPAMGVVLDLFIMRRLQHQAIVIRLMATLALLTVMEGLALLIWGNSERTLPPLFGEHTFSPVHGLNVTYDQAAMVAVAAAVAGLLWLLLHHSRIGVTMRAVVDDVELAELNGIDPRRVTSFSWALGTALAGIAAILIAPGLSLSIPNLSLLVVSAYAVAIVGRLASTVWTFVGGIGLGLASAYLVGYLPPGTQLVQDLIAALPFIALFVAVVALRQEGTAMQRVEALINPKTIRLRGSIFWGVIAIGLTLILSVTVSDFEALVLGTGLVYASILLSLVLLSGMAGQLSLAQFSFVGLAAVLISHLSHYMPWLVAVLLTTLITGLAGLLVCLPALRLRGLYLGLLTLACAVLMDTVFFTNTSIMGTFGAVREPAPSLFGITLRTHRSMLPLLCFIMVAFAVGVLAVRRASLGHALAALRDSPVAAAALGLPIVRTKAMIFFLSAAMSGLAGCLYGSLEGQVDGSQFTYVLSLTALLILSIQGLSSVVGAIAGAVFYALLYLMLPQWISNPDIVQGIQPFLIGLGVVNLAMHPEGVVLQQKAAWERMRRRWRPEVGSPPGAGLAPHTKMISYPVALPDGRS